MLRECIAKQGLKYSRQRELIAEVFLDSGGHLKVAELVALVRKSDPRVSQATVYRTMKLLADCGLAEARLFWDRQTRYEAPDAKVGHHDHLICTACGRIVEFVNDRIEELQREIAREQGFAVHSHKLEMYGLCRECRRRGVSRPGGGSAPSR